MLITGMPNMKMRRKLNRNNFSTDSAAPPIDNTNHMVRQEICGIKRIKSFSQNNHLPCPPVAQIFSQHKKKMAVVSPICRSNIQQTIEMSPQSSIPKKQEPLTLARRKPITIKRDTVIIKDFSGKEQSLNKVRLKKIIPLNSRTNVPQPNINKTLNQFVSTAASSTQLQRRVKPVSAPAANMGLKRKEMKTLQLPVSVAKNQSTIKSRVQVNTGVKRLCTKSAQPFRSCVSKDQSINAEECHFTSPVISTKRRLLNKQNIDSTNSVLQLTSRPILKRKNELKNSTTSAVNSSGQAGLAKQNGSPHQFRTPENHCFNSIEDKNSTDSRRSPESPFDASSCRQDFQEVLNKLDLQASPFSDDVEMVDVSANLQVLDVLYDAMDVDGMPDSLQSYIMVVDTNILIHELGFVDELKDTPIGGCGPPHIYIPWIVMCEIDKLKQVENKNQQKAKEVVRYVYHMLSTKHPRFHGQKARLSNELNKHFGRQNDDALLGYCTLLSKQYCKGKICLLTNDKNLCSKALINEINAYTRETIFVNIKRDIEVYQTASFVNKSASATNQSKKQNEEMAVDAIICEGKFILKSILEPFLKSSMRKAFGDHSKTFLSPSNTLMGILQYYRKYWISVFGFIVNRHLLKYFVTLTELFNFRRGFVCRVDDAFAALMAMENITKEIANYNPQVLVKVQRLTELTDKCRQLCKPEEEVVVKVIPVVIKNENEVVLGVFGHLWALMNHLCGMIMDFSGIAHNLNYEKPLVTPSLVEFQMLISNLFPAMHKTKQAMLKILDSSTLSEQEQEQNYKHLYDYLLQFVPSLQIPAQPPPTENFSVQGLKAFCLDPDYSEKFRIGYKQLTDLQKKLMECIHLPLWKS